jgi:hypothetical protein
MTTEHLFPIRGPVGAQRCVPTQAQRPDPPRRCALRRLCVLALWVGLCLVGCAHGSYGARARPALAPVAVRPWM